MRMPLTNSLSLLCLVTIAAACTSNPIAQETASDGSSSGSGGGTTATTTASTTLGGEDSSSSGVDSLSSTSATASATTADGSGSTAAETGDPECGPSAVCGQPAPAGWFGPAIYSRVVEGDAPACPAEYPSGGPTVLEGYHDPGPALCDCECNLNMMQTCSAYVYGHNNSSCNTYNYSQVTEACSAVSITAYAQFYAYLQNNPSCMQNKMEEFPAPQWDASIKSCKLGDNPTSCGEGGICTPVPGADFEAPVCIYKQGDEACPAGPYSNKVTFFTGVEDSRDCSSCTCGTVAANCDNAVADVYTGTECAGNPTSSLAANGGCVPAVGGSIAMAIDDASTCPITATPEPTGSIAAVGEFTFCCTG